MKSSIRLGIFSSVLCCSAVLAGCNDSETAEGNVKVFKGSGALQCQPDSGIALADMQMELVNAGVDVVCAQTGLDGFAYLSICGGSTGVINIYEIRAANLADAEALGFENVMVLPDYEDRVCE